MLELISKCGMWTSTMTTLFAIVVAISGAPYIYLVQFSLTILFISCLLWAVHVVIDEVQSRYARRD